MGMYKVTGQQFGMEMNLIKNLNTAVYNMPKDWDFVFAISGSGMVRVGKSVLGQQVAYYIADKMKTPFSLDNVVFSGSDLIQTAQRLPPHSAIIYDEARGELDSKKTMETITKNLLDFFAECGTYNHFIILILPDFFELNKNIAVHRSEVLLNVYKDAVPKTLKDGSVVLEYKRGYFGFYNRPAKKKLFIMGKKNYNSYCVKPTFLGEFPNRWLVDKDAYEQKKRAHIQRNKDDKNKKGDVKFYCAIKALCSLMSQRDAQKLLAEHGMKISQQMISIITNKETGEIGLN